MNDINKSSPLIEQRKAIIIINFVLVSVMLACFAYIVGQFIQTLYPGWDSTLFSILAFIIAFESLIVRYMQHTTNQFMQNPIVKTAVEIILLVMLIKLVSMLLAGFSTVWAEIVSWQRNFISNFFDPDTLFRTFGLLIVWFLALLFSQPINQLEEDEALMKQEKLGFTFNDRRDARRKLITLTFLVGFFMIIMMIVMKSNLDLIPNNLTPSNAFVGILIAYFFSGLVFLAINQYAIMKARWYFDDITVNPDLPKRWLVYTFIFILVVTLLIIFLPTNVALGFYPIARAVSEAIVFLVAVIQFILIIPIAFFITLITSLFSGKPVQDNFQESIPEFTPVLPQVSSTIPWWEWVKSIFFWGIFIGVIFFSIRYFLQSNPDFKAFLSRFRIGSWLRDFWQWLLTGFNRFQKASAETIRKGVANVRTFLSNRQLRLPSLADLAHRLPPRQAVILYYLDWVKWNRDHGIPRHISQTPLEYAQAHCHHNPEAGDSINAFTANFVTARYTRHGVDKDQARETQMLLSSLKEMFQASLNQDNDAP